MLANDDSRHGTTSGYLTHRCRCDRCRTANRIARKARKLSADDHRHGTVNGYVNFNCRCEKCRAALREYDNTRLREYRKRPEQRKKTREQAQSWRGRNLDRARTNTRRAAKNMRERNRAKATAKRAKGCMDCGGKATDLHHRDPAIKLFKMSEYGRSTGPYERELAKCDPLCKDCHRARHAKGI